MGECCRLHFWLAGVGGTGEGPQISPLCMHIGLLGALIFLFLPLLPLAEKHGSSAAYRAPGKAKTGEPRVRWGWGGDSNALVVLGGC